jgi:hypothetical protein
MFSLERVKRAPGVYVMMDLDEQPVYGGQSRNLQKRLVDHLIRQRSNVVTDGLLDIYEVRSVLIWYQARDTPLPLVHEDDQVLGDHLDILEAAILWRYRSRWNRGKPSWAGDPSELRLDDPHAVIPLIESSEELRFRSDRMERIENRLLHMLRAVRKARISGAPPKVLRGLSLHADELAELARRGLRRQRSHSDEPLFE